MLTNGQKIAYEWPYRQTNGRTGLKVVRDTSSWCGEYVCEIILKSNDWLQRYGQDTNLLTDGRTDGQTDGRTDRRPDDGDHNIIRPFGRIIIKHNNYNYHGQGVYNDILK